MGSKIVDYVAHHLKVKVVLHLFETLEKRDTRVRTQATQSVAPPLVLHSADLPLQCQYGRL